MREATAEGLRRVDEALAERGMLLVQGQGQVPSVADLLVGRPVTTRGYSHDYVPAWNLARSLADRPDIAMVRLVGGRRTLVERRFWPAIDGLARHNARIVSSGGATADHAALLRLIAENPGIPGASVKLALGLEGPPGSRRFQALKNDLLAWCCIYQTEQDEAEIHTHDQAWHPWPGGKVALGVGDGLSTAAATEVLTGAILGAAAAADRQIRKAIPLLSWV